MANPPSQLKSSSQKRKAERITKVYSDATIRTFSFAYFHLTLLRSSTAVSSTTREIETIDALSVKKFFTAALAQYFGIMGSAIPVDILKLDGQDAWVRVPFDDKSVVLEALSNWVGNDVAWRIRECGCWAGGLTGQNGHDLFSD
jgi:ribonuclease P/MRP protein subunit POP8